ncbi:MAG: hypothetical protein AAF721_15875 [Myxococcota bacterium]
MQLGDLGQRGADENRLGVQVVVARGPQQFTDRLQQIALRCALSCPGSPSDPGAPCVELPSVPALGVAHCRRYS